MGEEKPDEELMGKRKSSPRLSPAPVKRRYYHCDRSGRKYTRGRENFFADGADGKYTIFCGAAECGNIAPSAPRMSLWRRGEGARDSNVRVISGEARGRPLKAVPGHSTRPTTDKVKEALFSIIGPYFDGGRVLDLFAGTGGLGIEALSRGADHAVFIDANPKSVAVIRHNLEATGLAGKAEVYRNDAGKAVRQLERRGMKFDLIFLDPPYIMKDCADRLLDLAARGLVADGATAVVEHESGFDYGDRFGAFGRRRHATYGEVALSIYRYEGEA